MEIENSDEKLKSLREVLVNERRSYQEKRAAVHEIRDKLCGQNPPIKSILSADILTALIKFTKSSQEEDTLVETLWILLNVASGDQEDVTALLQNDVHKFIMDHLKANPSNEVLYNIAWGLANLAYNSHKTRDTLLEQNALDLLLDVIQQRKDEFSSSTRNRVAWAICALNDLKPCPKIHNLKGVADYLCYSLKNETEFDIIRYNIKAVRLILRNPINSNIECLKDNGVLSQLQKNFLRLDNDDVEGISEYVYCFRYFITDDLRDPDLLAILSEKKTFKKLLALTKHWKDIPKIIKLIVLIIEEDYEAFEKLLQYSPEILETISTIIESESSSAIWQDAIMLLGNFLSSGGASVKRAVLSRKSKQDKSIFGIALKSISKLKFSVMISLLEGIVSSIEMLNRKEDSDKYIKYIMNKLFEGKRPILDPLKSKKNDRIDALINTITELKKGQYQDQEQESEEDKSSSGDENSSEDDIYVNRLLSNKKKRVLRRMNIKASAVEEGRKHLIETGYDPKLRKTIKEKELKQSVDFFKKSPKKDLPRKDEVSSQSRTNSINNLLLKEKPESGHNKNKPSEKVNEAKSPNKAIKRTRTITQTLKEAKKIMADIDISTRMKSIQAGGNLRKNPKKNNANKNSMLKRTRTIAETIQENKELVENYGRGKRQKNEGEDQLSNGVKKIKK